jgi:Protein of unknown function (DUF4235)
VAKFLFLPLSIGAGLLSGLLARKAFEQLWGLVDKEEPPHAEHREVRLPKLIAALAVEGAVFRAVKGLTDHGARRSFARLTGTWPGEEQPEPE